MLRIALNGYGRIGRALVRALFERGLDQRLRIEAINDLGDFESLAHLTRFDSTFGRFHGHVALHDNHLQVNSQTIHLLRERDPVNLPWAQLGVDLVLECSGKMKKRAQVEQHLTAGAPRVLLSHPLDSADLTVVYGVNHEQLGSQQIVSNASCTTNCLAPLAMLLHRSVGIRSGLVTTVHAYTNDQNLLDKSHGDLYRARAAAVSMIPTSTGAAKAIGLVLPELAGRLDGLAVRVPTPNVSLLDLSFIAERPAGRDAINATLEAGARDLPSGVMECNALPLVSSDFNGHPVSCVVDLNHTRVQGDLVKVLAWYDNEWAFANRMLDVVLAWMAP
ncbi:type I glyceraldehyde-3-phosphate dehydrogenase [Pseudomonas sp. JM0905a]|uniref:Glyceraldehyde-3-phosphate dehydrogenase n=1 Tax=Metapseudomonas resinovorans TaxID=53412 RepID=A0ABT4Y1W0_METRE|nr:MULTISPECIES: type I glyceraldehyde-3-phosphate dehydrogenase [Pseudomonas]MBD2839364.1 type I glyceraldehyde-3-phosphate dehydrogenase [Pseudomonas sp. JM0905a]MDA8482824.1 type I glyceraldehyde-3-phosphate dehydrogenase [Pseudomonas resinovorans]